MAKMKNNWKKKAWRLDNDKDLFTKNLKNVKVHTPTKHEQQWWGLICV